MWLYLHTLLNALVGHKGNAITETECVEENKCCWDASTVIQLD